MKLLLDENISDRLPNRLNDLYPGSKHIVTAGLAGADDLVIWDYARQYGFTVVTQDSDFADRIEIHGAPPKVIWLRCGNTSTREIERMLRQNVKSLADLENDPDLDIIELFF